MREEPRAAEACSRSIGIGLLCAVEILERRASESSPAPPADRPLSCSALSCRGHLDDVARARPRPCAARDRVEPRALLGQFFALALLRVGLEQHRGAMLVVDQPFADQALEHALAGGELRSFSALQRRLEGQRTRTGSPPCSQVRMVRNISAMPRGNEPVLFSRSANSNVLIAASIGLRIDAVIGQLAQRFEDQRLDLVAIGLVDALHADREHRLAHSRRRCPSR